MPIKVPSDLPALKSLERENIFVMHARRAEEQDIRPLRLLLLNLMPTKLETETQILRCLSNTPLQLELDLLQTSSYKATHVSEEHLLDFYMTFDEIEHLRYDGMIITGAPVEHMEFEKVAYWKELCRIMDWSRENVFSTLHICWGAQAGLYHHYGIQKYPLASKKFGVFEHTVAAPNSPLMRGFDAKFLAPHSRHTEVRAEDVARVPELEILSTGEKSGLYIAATRDRRRLFVTGHCEYDADTLAREYFRDLDKGLDIAVPENYFPNDDPSLEPPLSWRAHAMLLYSNWLNDVYQQTPYDLNDL